MGADGKHRLGHPLIASFPYVRITAVTAQADAGAGAALVTVVAEGCFSNSLESSVRHGALIDALRTVASDHHVDEAQSHGSSTGLRMVAFGSGAARRGALAGAT